MRVVITGMGVISPIGNDVETFGAALFEGKCGIGRPGPSTPWGKPALGLKTRLKNKQSNKLIIRRRDGSTIKNK